MEYGDILVLYLLFRAKQVACDFLLQPSWMAAAKGEPFAKGGARALAMHAGIHAAFTFFITMFFSPAFWWLGLVDFCVHLSIDKVKAVITNKMGCTYKDNAYWWVFGLDQEAHNLTHLLYILLIVK